MATSTNWEPFVASFFNPCFFHETVKELFLVSQTNFLRLIYIISNCLWPSLDTDIILCVNSNLLLENSELTALFPDRNRNLA